MVARPWLDGLFIASGLVSGLSLFLAVSPSFFVFLPLEASESLREGGWLFPEFLTFPPASRYLAEEVKIFWSTPLPVLLSVSPPSQETV